jgi:hypothetical protein
MNVFMFYDKRSSHINKMKIEIDKLGCISESDLKYLKLSYEIGRTGSIPSNFSDNNHVAIKTNQLKRSSTT